jgi:tetratricopeptide (TPR) repeat protein
VGLRSTIAIDRANALLRLKRFEEALEDCNLSIEFGKPTTNAYIIRSMANTSLLKFEEAVRDLEEATSIDPDSGIIKERLKKAQMELRKSKRVDYYKVLGVSEVGCCHTHLSATSRLPARFFPRVPPPYARALETSAVDDVWIAPQRRRRDHPTAQSYATSNARHSSSRRYTSRGGGAPLEVAVERVALHIVTLILTHAHIAPCALSPANAAPPWIRRVSVWLAWSFVARASGAREQIQ